MRRTFYLITCVLLCAVALAGCSSGEKTVVKTTWEKDFSPVVETGDSASNQESNEAQVDAGQESNETQVDAGETAENEDEARTPRVPTVPVQKPASPDPDGWDDPEDYANANSSYFNNYDEAYDYWLEEMG